MSKPPPPHHHCTVHPIAALDAQCEDCMFTLAQRHPVACREPECLLCGMRDCPLHEPLHYHHDGCPVCVFDAE